MNKLAAALAGVVCALALIGAASATTYGVAEDGAKYADDGGASYYALMSGLGLTEDRITVLWDPANPTAIAEKAFLDRSLPVAAARGIHVVFAVYPSKATAFADSPGAPAQFCSWVSQLARTYPQVRAYVVGNEPNQPRFQQPQFDSSGSGVAAATFEPVLATCYDELKAVDPGISVIGLGLSPRGNDRPDAANNVSTSPVRFLRDLGATYRASGRTAPLMDLLSFHPYPNVNSDPLTKGYQWPGAGVPNLDRIKQAFWDAFNGTPQPTFAEDGAAGSLRFVLDEVGWQVDTAGDAAYTGVENVPVVSESSQAQTYADLVRLVACDSSVDSVHFFHLVDEPDRDRFQSGLYTAGGAARGSAASVRAAIAQGGCSGAPGAWRHATTVIGAQASFGNLTRPRSLKQRSWNFSATAQEDATYKAGIFPAKGTSGDIVRALQSGSAQAALSSGGVVKAYYTPLVRFPLQRLKPGSYVYAITLRAAMNPSRMSTFVSKAFKVR